jgi:hypothetical protein
MRQKVTISLDSEIAEKLRLQSLKKYGNSRSMSRLIEDLATGAAEMEQPEACSILGQRSENSFIEEDIFKKGVEKITAQLPEIEFLQKLDPRGYAPMPAIYFMLKEACEIEINKYADSVNHCWSCAGLNGPLPKCPDAGKNFVIYASMDNSLR